MVRSYDLAFESNRVSVPAMGSCCLATLMSSDRTELSVNDYICLSHDGTKETNFPSYFPFYESTRYFLDLAQLSHGKTGQLAYHFFFFFFLCFLYF